MSEGKSVWDVMESLSQTDLALSKKKFIKRKRKVMRFKVLRARCKRLANRNTTVGNTNFSFNGEGIAEVLDMGDTRRDFDLLVRKNGVEDLRDQPSDEPYVEEVLEEVEEDVSEEAPAVEEEVSRYEEEQEEEDDFSSIPTDVSSLFETVNVDIDSDEDQEG